MIWQTALEKRISGISTTSSYSDLCILVPVCGIPLVKIWTLWLFLLRVCTKKNSTVIMSFPFRNGTSKMICLQDQEELLPNEVISCSLRGRASLYNVLACVLFHCCLSWTGYIYIFFFKWFKLNIHVHVHYNGLSNGSQA